MQTTAASSQTSAPQQPMKSSPLEPPMPCIEVGVLAVRGGRKAAALDHPKASDRAMLALLTCTNRDAEGLPPAKADMAGTF